MSRTIGKYFQKHNLITTEDATANHSARHSMKDRLREASVEENLIDEILGHKESGIKYGSGFSIRRKYDALSKVALDYNEKII